MFSWIKSLNHINHVFVAALLMLASVPLIWLPPIWIPAIVAITFYFSRERTSYQRKAANEAGVDQSEMWLKAFAFWKWTPDGKADFFWPAGFAIAVTIAIILVL